MRVHVRMRFLCDTWVCVYYCRQPLCFHVYIRLHKHARMHMRILITHVCIHKPRCCSSTASKKRLDSLYSTLLFSGRRHVPEDDAALRHALNTHVHVLCRPSKNKTRIKKFATSEARRPCHMLLGHGVMTTLFKASHDSCAGDS